MTHDHLYRFRLSDVTSVRVRCKGERCRTVLEVSLANLPQLTSCPLFRAPFEPEDEPGLLAAFVAAAAGLQRAGEFADVEFLLPGPAG
jgi:hypothetical protein